MSPRIGNLLLFCCLAVFVVTQYSQQVNGQAFVPPAKPFPVWVQIRMKSLEKVNGVDRTFDADFDLFQMTFTSVPKAAINNSDFVPLTAATKASLGLTFDYDFENSNDFKVLQNSEFLTSDPMPWMYTPIPINGTLFPDFNVTAYYFRWQRVKATFTSQLPLQDFPFDKQKVSVKVRMRLPVDVFHLIAHPTAKFTSNLEGLLQWEKQREETVEELFQLEGVPEKFSMLSFDVFLKRIPNYYYLKIISGVAMVVVMNWMLFGLDISDSNRIAVAATLFLAIVAYLFLVSNDVPKVAYATRLDNFVLLSMINIFISVLLFTLEYIVDKHAENLLKHEEEQEAENAAKEDEAEEETRVEEVKRDQVYELDQSVGKDDTEQNGNGDNGATKEAPATNGDAKPKKERPAPAAAKPARQWYHSWHHNKRKVDVVCLLITVLMYVIGAPVILWG